VSATPAGALEEINRQLCQQVFNGQFVTMLIVVIDTANQHLDIAVGGIPRRWSWMAQRSGAASNRNWCSASTATPTIPPSAILRRPPSNW